MIREEVEAAQAPVQRVERHPLADARAEQEASERNRRLGLLIREAIIRRLSEPPYRVHADDLESDYPAGEVERCRKLAPAQFGGLAGAGHIHGVEYRKSTVAARKGSKSWVYEFTLKGREKFAGLGAGLATPQGPQGPSSPLEASTQPGGDSAEPSRLFEPAPARPRSAIDDDLEAA